MSFINIDSAPILYFRRYLSESTSRYIFWFLTLILFAYVLPSTFMWAMHNTLDHDENQFIAAAKITADEGLLSYQDYRFMHMPYYVFFIHF